MNGKEFSANRSRLDVLCYGLSMFLAAKSKMSPRHEYAACLMLDTALWYTDFTSNTEDFKRALRDLRTQGSYMSFDMNSLFQEIKERADLPSPDTSADYVVRVILFYSRSKIIPHLPVDRSSMDEVLHNPNFFLDSVYLHERPSPENIPQDVYDFITRLEGPKAKSFFFENAGNLPKFLYQLATLTANPAQRAEQPNHKTHFPIK